MITAFSLTTKPNQKIAIRIPGDTRTLALILRLSYNAEARYWTLSIYSASSEPLVLNIPLLCGQDLLKPYAYLGIGRAALYNTGLPGVEQPDSTNLDKFLLRWRLD